MTSKYNLFRYFVSWPSCFFNLFLIDASKISPPTPPTVLFFYFVIINVSFETNVASFPGKSLAVLLYLFMGKHSTSQCGEGPFTSVEMHDCSVTFVFRLKPKIGF